MSCTLEPQSISIKNQLFQPTAQKNLILEAPFTFNVDHGAALRIYPDSRPRNLEIAALQKGLVLLHEGEEVVEEGAGFGSPIAMYGEEAYFCRTARTELLQLDRDSVTLKKTFYLDSVSRKAIRGFRVNNGLYMFVHRTFERGYLKKQKARPVFDWMMHLRGVLGVETKFVDAQPKGEVTINYHLENDRVGIRADFSKMDKADCGEILILNEQGAISFPRYRDSDTALLVGREVEAWARVGAKEATFVNPATGLSFSLRHVEGADLVRGREQVKNRFAWAGLTYLLPPETVEFAYTIRLGCDSGT